VRQVGLYLLQASILEEIWS